MSVEAGSLPRSSGYHRTIQTDKPSCLAKSLHKAGLCLLIGGALAGMFLLGMSVPRASPKDIPSSAALGLALQDTFVLADSTEVGVNSKALIEERQLVSEVKGRATEEIIVGVEDFDAETPQFFDWQPKSGKSMDDDGSQQSRGTTKSAKTDTKSSKTGSPTVPVTKPPTHREITTHPTPETCQDVPDWAQPDEGVWSSTAFANMTCAALEATVSNASSEEQEKWCSFLSQGVFSVPSANQACCFCGGGDHVEPKCSNMVWNTMQPSVDCDFIDSLPSADIDSFCATFGDETFVQDGLTLKEACCACGGGELNMNRNAGRRLHKSRSLQDEREVDIRDWTSRNGLGESPGIPNLEFLGLGYDLVRGNPRGSEKSELDPGFGYRVVRLVQSQDNLTVDGAFTVPMGTDVKYIHSCKFDKSSTEVSSERDIRTSLQSEASFSRSESSSLSGGLSVSLGFVSLGASANQETNESFSQNSNVKRAAETNARESLVAFESKAICKEYQASFIPGYDLVLDPTFVKARDALPVPYDKNNRRHRVLWAQFFDNYGTSYVNYLVLGGKQVSSFSMTSQEYTSLVSQSVDVSSTMSYEMSWGMSASASAKKGLTKGAEEPTTTPLTVGKGGAVGTDNRVAGLNVISINLENKNEDSGGGGPELPSKEVSGSFSTENSEATSEFARNLNAAEAAEKISKKNLKFSEYTLGGNPNADWRAWAATVASRPMPVQYEVGSLVDFMTFEESDAADEAFRDIYGLTLTGQEPILEGTTKFGVYTGLGQPLVQSTLDPNNDNRVLMQGDIVGQVKDGDPEYGEPLEGSGLCLDDEGRYYDEVLFLAIWRGDTPFPIDEDESRRQCENFCTGLENSALQVGFGYLFDPFGVFSCVCYYNSGQAPDKVEFDPLEKLPLGDSPIKRINTGLSGWGVPTQTDGLPDAKCFPNLAFKDRSPVFTFTDTYKGKIERPRAIFATPIRGFVGDDEDEDVEFAFGGRSWEADFFFALSSEINAGLSVAVTSFGRSAQDLTKATLPAYSFVTSDSMGKLFGDGDSDDFLTGVVSPQGLLLDRNRDLVSVSRKGETLTIFPGSFKVTRVSVEFNSPMNGQPTVILFPVWYKPDESTLDEVFPASAAQLFLTVHQISEGGFEAILDGASPVGFNFLAIGPDIPTKNVKHGLVSVCTQTVPPILSQLNGISIGGECPGAETEDTPGVLLNFDEPFSDIPSVIATPHARLSNNRCIVESITVSSARVKCTENPDDINFIPVPFTFVAIGETAE